MSEYYSAPSEQIELLCICEDNFSGAGKETVRGVKDRHQSNAYTKSALYQFSHLPGPLKRGYLTKIDYQLKPTALTHFMDESRYSHLLLYPQ